MIIVGFLTPLTSAGIVTENGPWSRNSISLPTHHSFWRFISYAVETMSLNNINIDRSNTVTAPHDLRYGPSFEIYVTWLPSLCQVPPSGRIEVIHIPPWVVSFNLRHIAPISSTSGTGSRIIVNVSARDRTLAILFTWLPSSSVFQTKVCKIFVNLHRVFSISFILSFIWPLPEFIFQYFIKLETVINVLQYLLFTLFWSKCWYV
jgi:hypothetical protein